MQAEETVTELREVQVLVSQGHGVANANPEIGGELAFK